jgi:hypothetical protein
VISLGSEFRANSLKTWTTPSNCWRLQSRSTKKEASSEHHRSHCLWQVHWCQHE